MKEFTVDSWRELGFPSTEAFEDAHVDVLTDDYWEARIRELGYTSMEEFDRETQSLIDIEMEERALADGYTSLDAFLKAIEAERFPPAQVGIA